MIKDCASCISEAFPFENWLWGENQSFDDQYNKLYGESVMNFEAKQFISSSNLVELLTTNINGDTKAIFHSARILYNLSANVP